MRVRLLAFGALVLVAAAGVVVALRSGARIEVFDPRHDNAARATVLADLPAGTPRPDVERRIGRGASTPPDGVGLPRRVDCAYYTELGETTYLQAGYRGGRLLYWRRPTRPPNDGYSD